MVIFLQIVLLKRVVHPFGWLDPLNAYTNKGLQDPLFIRPLGTADMIRRLITFALLGLFWSPAFSYAGLYYSGESIANLPSQWRGFLLDQRALGTIAVPPRAGTQASPLRQQYLKKAAELDKSGLVRKLSADELADLGAIYVRLGDVTRAVELLRRAQGDYPNHFGQDRPVGGARPHHTRRSRAVSDFGPAQCMSRCGWES